MGLDNGIIIRPKNQKAEDFLSENFSDFCESCYSFPSYELVYWRKCWNLRAAMFKNGFAKDEDRCYLKIKDLETVVEKVIKPFLNEEKWNENDDEIGCFRVCSLWTWTEMITQLAQEIYNLRTFVDYAENEGLTDEDFTIYFYDSY